MVVDSRLWRRTVWPEGEVLLFNNPVEDRSAAWGTSPPLWYATSALPRALGLALPLSIVGAILESECRTWFVSAFASVVLLSFIPHKELRFVFPALPLLNLCAAVACERLWRSRVLRIAVLGVVAATAAATLIIFAPASRNNYPGGMALRLLHDDWGYAHGKPAVVHLDDLTLHDGCVALRGRTDHESWTYDKRDGLLDYDEFDFRIAELPVVDETLDVVATVEAFSGLKIDLKQIPVPPRDDGAADSDPEACETKIVCSSYVSSSPSSLATFAVFIPLLPRKATAYSGSDAASAPSVITSASPSAPPGPAPRAASSRRPSRLEAPTAPELSASSRGPCRGTRPCRAWEHRLCGNQTVSLTSGRRAPI